MLSPHLTLRPKKFHSAALRITCDDVIMNNGRLIFRLSVGTSSCASASLAVPASKAASIFRTLVTPFGNKATPGSSLELTGWPIDG
jgi:hypothetical protein